MAVPNKWFNKIFFRAMLADFGFRTPYSGKIALYNQHQMEKVIQVFLLIQTMKAPGKKAEPLFARFTKTDIAAILRQFEENNNKKPNTLQGYVTDANDMLRLDDPKVKKLAAALQDFFY